jgi:pimeloyl-ACP methyl ester carboxylesterase
VKIEMPALFIAGASDPVLQMVNPEGMQGSVTDLRGTVIIPDTGHWVQQERPDEVNEALLGFLAKLP